MVVRDTNGRYSVVGMNTWGINGRENQNYSIPSSDVMLVINKAIASQATTALKSRAETFITLLGKTDDKTLDQLESYIGFNWTANDGWKSFNDVVRFLPTADIDTWYYNLFDKPYPTLRRAVGRLVSERSRSTLLELVEVGEITTNNDGMQISTVRYKVISSDKIYETQWVLQQGLWSINSSQLPFASSSSKMVSGIKSSKNNQTAGFGISDEDFNGFNLGLGFTMVGTNSGTNLVMPMDTSQAGIAANLELDYRWFSNWVFGTIGMGFNSHSAYIESVYGFPNNGYQLATAKNAFVFLGAGFRVPLHAGSVHFAPYFKANANLGLFITDELAFDASFSLLGGVQFRVSSFGLSLEAGTKTSLYKMYSVSRPRTFVMNLMVNVLPF